MGIIAWIIIGLLAGAIAKARRPRRARRGDHAPAGRPAGAVVYVLCGAFRRRHLLAEDRRHLAHVLHGRPHQPRMLERNANRLDLSDLIVCTRALHPARPPGPLLRRSSTPTTTRLPDEATVMCMDGHDVDDSPRDAATAADPRGRRSGPSRPPRPTLTAVKDGTNHSRALIFGGSGGRGRLPRRPYGAAGPDRRRRVRPASNRNDGKAWELSGAKAAVGHERMCVPERPAARSGAPAFQAVPPHRHGLPWLLPTATCIRPGQL
ncbi:hypothetical protein BM536_001070 [Streptomyces phaeoluteigriseus]|uniref:Uncharacterized protein n=1 Tax=Streptomyces phaeoluteigriseus TaxID=114686 RepID=A0A1V6MZA2_9ACTN|nr:GlsB/YeaQ/YmgE family stress response membrane protein [Streptomyces phaeoluteigriseus]OQD57712.1 hypothetical protein BM536_001070 [Streptomyces phaeoluteigriseus]